MSHPESVAIVAERALSPAAYEQVEALRAACNAHDGLDLKLEVWPERPGEPVPMAPGQFLAYDGDMLVGYCSAVGNREVEICGMVRPDRRRHGAGRRLLDAALAACRGRGAADALLLCEDASAPGRAFVAMLNAPRAFAEYRMELEVPAGPVADDDFPQENGLTIDRATPADLDAIASVRAAAFQDDLDGAREAVREGLEEPYARFYVARQGGVPVASLKVYTTPEHRAGIYAFGVVPPHRRRGYASQFLRRVASALAAEGYGRIWLEVDSDNDPAIALYRSVGFHHTTTYGYYRLAL